MAPQSSTHLSTPGDPAFVFDLDGTLLDSVYLHVTAWQRAFAEVGVDLAVWRIHRRIGMSGGLLAHRVTKESGVELTQEQQDKAEELHGKYYLERLDWVQPLPGARDLLLALSDAGIPWVIASSGKQEEAEAHIEKLDLPETPTYVSSADVESAKPNPEMFLAAAAKIEASVLDCIAVGDATWDMLAARRARMLGVGLTCGGYSTDALQRAHAFRVYYDPADLHRSLDEIGVML
jgi:HAD superfamily hydrolase (TIGR01509 family)